MSKHGGGGRYGAVLEFKGEYAKIAGKIEGGKCKLTSSCRSSDNLKHVRTCLWLQVIIVRTQLYISCPAPQESCITWQEKFDQSADFPMKFSRIYDHQECKMASIYNLKSINPTYLQFGNSQSCLCTVSRRHAPERER
jgi:hypothetical protein